MVFIDEFSKHQNHMVDKNKIMSSLKHHRDKLFHIFSQIFCNSVESQIECETVFKIKHSDLILNLTPENTGYSILE